MKYIINLSIVFDADAKILVLKNNPHLYVELSKPATRLLCELIINNNVTLIRDDIIKTVWVDYGFSPSQATLNNHISELRKAFESLGGAKEIIITEPKIGFRMEAEIHPVLKQGDTLKHIVNDNPINNGDIPPNDIIFPELESRTSISRKKTWFKAGTIALGIISFSIVAGGYFFNSRKDEIINLVATNGKCNIYGLSNAPPPSNLIANARDMIESKNIDCTNDTVDVYYTDARQDSSLLTIRFMAVCYTDDDKYYQHCKSYKLVK